jgi:hypothetical protein
LATTDEIAVHWCAFSTERYVAAEEVEDDGEPFVAMMKRLVESWGTDHGKFPAGAADLRQSQGLGPYRPIPGWCMDHLRECGKEPADWRRRLEIANSRCLKSHNFRLDLRLGGQRHFSLKSHRFSHS